MDDKPLLIMTVVLLHVFNNYLDYILVHFQVNQKP